MDRFKDDLMLGVDKGVVGEGLQESLPVLTRDRLVAEDAEGLEFGGELCFAVHWLPRRRRKFSPLGKLANCTNTSCRSRYS